MRENVVPQHDRIIVRFAASESLETWYATARKKITVTSQICPLLFFTEGERYSCGLGWFQPAPNKSQAQFTLFPIDDVSDGCCSIIQPEFVAAASNIKTRRGSTSKPHPRSFYFYIFFLCSFFKNIYAISDFAKLYHCGHVVQRLEVPQCSNYHMV